jgi:hypothetical protein
MELLVAVFMPSSFSLVVRWLEADLASTKRARLVTSRGKENLIPGDMYSR